MLGFGELSAATGLVVGEPRIDGISDHADNEGDEQIAPGFGELPAATGFAGNDGIDELFSLDELRRPLPIVITDDEDEICEEERAIHVGIVEEERNDENHSGLLEDEEDDEISEDE